MYEAVQKNPVLQTAEYKAIEQLYMATEQEMMSGIRLQQEGFLRNTAESISSVSRKLVTYHRLKKKKKPQTKMRLATTFHLVLNMLFPIFPTSDHLCCTVDPTSQSVNVWQQAQIIYLSNCLKSKRIIFCTKKLQINHMVAFIIHVTFEFIV